MAIVSKYRKGAYMSTIVPLLMLVACIGMFYLFIGSLNGDGFAYTSIWLSIVLLFLAVMFGWLAVLSFKLYSRKVIDGNELKYYLPYIPLLVFYKDIDDYDAKYYVRTFDGTTKSITSMLLFLPFIAADVLFLRFALYSNYKKLKKRMLELLDSQNGRK